MGRGGDGGIWTWDFWKLPTRLGGSEDGFLHIKSVTPGWHVLTELKTYNGKGLRGGNQWQDHEIELEKRSMNDP